MPHRQYSGARSRRAPSRGIRLIAAVFVTTLAYGCDDSDSRPDDDDPRAEASFELPVEVLGAPGLTVARSFDLDEGTASDATELYLQINNLSYQNKARIRVNGGSWVSLNHSTVSMAEPESARGGMVHGGYNTIRMTLPLPSAVEPGSNTVDFEFSKSDGVSMGYRVIDFNLLDASGEELLPDDFFSEDDPATWEPPFSDAANIEAGRDLWRARNRLKSNYLQSPGSWYDNPIPAAKPIKASCADCHAEDGRDLELFAYSNHSIIERAKFHSLSELEGKQIASYIRSLSDEPEVGRYGRPWNPPFQPGPSIAERPIHEWPAGAGLDAVLEDDADMLQSMFPDPTNITQADVDAFFDRTKMVNPVLQPLAIQFPDWKHWLPLVHPMDAFSKQGYWDSGSIEYSPKREYERIRGKLLDGGYANKKAIIDDFSKLSHHFRQFLAQGSAKKNHWRTSDGDAIKKGLADGITRELAATSLARLQAVKFVEFHTEFSLMGMTDDEPGTRKRQFIGRAHQAFNPPPHFTGCFEVSNCDHFDGQPEATGDFETTNWYHLSQVLNPGNKVANYLGSMDYNYQPQFILKASASSGICEPVRYYYSQLIHFQTRTRADIPPEQKGGFYMRQKGPWQILGADNRNSTGGLARLEIPECLNDIQPGLGRMVVGAQLRNFLDVMDEPRNDLGGWPRRASASSGNDRYLEAASISQSQMPNTNGTFSGKLLHYVHKIYNTMNGFLDIGVDCATFNAYRAWAAEAWPNVNWGQFVCTGAPADDGPPPPADDDPPPPSGDSDDPPAPADDCTPTSGNSLHRASSTAVPLTIGKQLRSTSGSFGLKLQGDGNVVLRNLDTSSAVWASGTSGHGGQVLYLQGDGNLVLRNGSGNALWSSKTGGASADRLLVTDSGDAVLLSGGAVVWSARDIATCN